MALWWLFWHLLVVRKLHCQTLETIRNCVSHSFTVARLLCFSSTNTSALQCMLVVTEWYVHTMANKGSHHTHACRQLDPIKLNELKPNDVRCPITAHTKIINSTMNTDDVYCNAMQGEHIVGNYSLSLSQFQTQQNAPTSCRNRQDMIARK